MDLSKAFDRVKHSAAVKALKLQGASLQCVALFCAMMQQSKMAFSLGGVRTLPIALERGLPQGAPESPLVFVMVTELVLRPLLARWRERGSGWAMDSLWIAAVCYADDIILLSSSKADLHRMIHELVDGFAAVGLSIGAEKTHWTSLPTAEGEVMRVVNADVAWEPSITFVGAVVDLSGSEALAIDYRTAQAMKAWGRWKPFLRCSKTSAMKRCWLVYRAVFASALWLAQCWVPNQSQRSKLRSWGARIIARTYGVKRKSDEDVGGYWKRLHRTGHVLCKRLGGSAEDLRQRTKLSWAGHLARTNNAHLRLVLRTRCLSWWRFFQHPVFPLHGGRFGRPVRWESELEERFGRAATDTPLDVNVGWMALAQDRESWRSYQ